MKAFVCSAAVVLSLGAAWPSAPIDYFTQSGGPSYVYLYIPNPQTGSFLYDNYEQPSSIVGNLQVYNEDMRLAEVPIWAMTALVAATGLPSPGHGATPAELACARRNPSLVEYTFQMKVAMKMRHFPWLRFGIAGTGKYVRGQAHIVRFTKLPLFAKGLHQIDLSSMDPCMWPKSYAVSLSEKSGGMTTFLLRPLKTNPRDPNPMVDALVTLDSADSTREVIVHYSRGSIALQLTPTAIGEYRLPASADVSINMPGQALSAHAELTNYAITRQGADVAAPIGSSLP